MIEVQDIFAEFGQKYCDERKRQILPTFLYFLIYEIITSKQGGYSYVKNKSQGCLGATNY